MSVEDSFTPRLQMDVETAVALAIERDRQMEAGEVSPILHDEMMARLRNAQPAVSATRNGSHPQTPYSTRNGVSPESA